MVATSYPPIRGKDFGLYFNIPKNDGTIIADPAGLAARVVVNDRGYDLSGVRVVDSTIGTCFALIPGSLTNAAMIAFHASASDAGALPYTERIHTAGQSLDQMQSRAQRRKGGWR